MAKDLLKVLGDDRDGLRGRERKIIIFKEEPDQSFGQKQLTLALATTVSCAPLKVWEPSGLVRS